MGFDTPPVTPSGCTCASPRGWFTGWALPPAEDRWQTAPVARVTLTWDCTDPDRLAGFWCEALGYRKGRGVAQYRAIHAGAETRYDFRTRILFQGVPEPKSTKNRLHLDLDLQQGDSMDTEVERLTGLGATIAYTHEEFGTTWTTMRDPEGNEFCVVAPPEERQPSQD